MTALCICAATTQQIVDSEILLYFLPFFQSVSQHLIPSSYRRKTQFIYRSMSPPVLLRSRSADCHRVTQPSSGSYTSAVNWSLPRVYFNTINIHKRSETPVLVPHRSSCKCRGPEHFDPINNIRGSEKTGSATQNYSYKTKQKL